MAIITNKATVHGMVGTVAHSRMAATKCVLVASDITDEAQVDEFKNGVGEVLGLAIRDKRLQMKLDYYPIDTVLSGAALACALPPNPDVVTVLGLAGVDTIAGAGFNSNSTAPNTFIYKGGGTVSFMQDGQAKISIPVTNYVTAPTPSAMATAVS